MATDSHRSPLVIAHRGAITHAPENTMAAFEAALTLGVDAIEADVRVSRDGVAVLVHDADLRRVAGHDGRVVELDAAALAAIDVGAGETVPTLESLARRCVPTGAHLLLDLKVDAAGAAVDAALTAAGLPFETAWICTWNADQDADARAHLPSAPRLFLEDRLERSDPAFFAGLQARGYAGLSLAHGSISPQLVAAAHASGLVVHAWTVNEPANMRAMRAAGVDGIITDDPDALRRQLSGPA